MAAADVAVIGGGIVGTATAAFLAEAGARVTLHERTAIAAGASGRNSGIVQHPFDPVLVGLYRASLDLYRDLAADPDPALELPAEPAGLLLVGRDERIAARIAADWSLAHPGAEPSVVAGAALRALEPALAAGLAACRLAIGYPVEPASATRAFAARAERAGVRLAVGETAVPAVDGDRIVGVRVGRAGDRLVPAGAVVVAAGPWTPDVLDPSGAWRPIAPVWGVVAAIGLADPPCHALEEAEIDIEPDDPEPSSAPAAASPLVPVRSGGRRRAEGAEDSIADRPGVDFSLVTAGRATSLGSTFLPDEPDSAAYADALRARGSRFVPAIAAAPLLGVRACARPVSRDGRPLVGAVPGLRDAWIAAGHGPWGISTGPGTARILADLVLGRMGAAGVPAALDPARFGRPGASA